MKSKNDETTFLKKLSFKKASGTSVYDDPNLESPWITLAPDRGRAEVICRNLQKSFAKLFSQK